MGEHQLALAEAQDWSRESRTVDALKVWRTVGFLLGAMINM